MRCLLISIFVITTTLSSACMMGGVPPAERFRDSVHRYNDEVRWHRISQASSFVAPASRARFMRQHASFKADVRVAETELQSLRMIDGDDSKDAESQIRYTWYEQRTMMLRTAVVQQQWRKVGSAFVLVEESILEGDDSLFADAEPPQLDGDATGLAQSK